MLTPEEQADRGVVPMTGLFSVLKRLDLDAKTLLVFHLPAGMTRGELHAFREALREWVQQLSPKPLVVLTPYGVTLERLDEEAMRQAGWVRAEPVPDAVVQGEK